MHTNILTHKYALNYALNLAKICVLYAGKLAAHGSVHLTIVVINRKSPAEGG